MNYHIMVDHWFIDSFIEDVYALGEEQNNIFLLRNTEGENKYIKHKDKVKWLGDDYEKLLLILENEITTNDKIFIHWFDMGLGNLLLNIPNEIEIHAYLWGSDFFEDPYLYHKKRIYQSRTLNYVNSLEKAELIDHLRNNKPAMLPLQKLVQWKRGLHVKKTFLQKTKHIRRLKSIILHPASTGDARLTRSIYQHPYLLAKNGFYDLNFDLAQEVNQQEKSTEERKIKVMLGNSAFYSGNHLDAFEAVKTAPDNFHFYSPLAYGFDGYKEMVIKQGIAIFGNRFTPITEFIPREKYIAFLQDMDILFLYQNISQAFGNIIAALTLGKPIFLRKINTLFELFENVGIKVYDADNIANIKIKEAIKEAFQSKEKNIEILKRNFSKESRLSFLKDVLS